MNTKIYQLTGDPVKDDIMLMFAARKIASGQTVALPTETVYGLGASIYFEQAIKNIFIAKGRPQDNPLIVHVDTIEMAKTLTTDFNEQALALANKFWPGPLSIILPKSGVVSDAVSGGLDTVAIRMPGNEVARKLISYSGHPVAAPSANLSGSPSPTKAQHVIDDLDGRVDAIVCSDNCVVGVESTVVSLAGEKPILLRPGAVTLEDLQSVLGEVLVSSAITNQLKDGEVAQSPGMKYKHYAPTADVKLVDGSDEAYKNFVNEHAGEGVFALCFAEDVPDLKVPCVVYGLEGEPDTQASGLFAALRELDEKGAVTVYAHCPKQDGVSLAVYNRLIRAAAFEVIKLV